MADRFPSIEDFDEGDTKVQGGAGGQAAAADDDFLTRERAALGDDAMLFSGPSDSMHASATVEDGEDDLLGGGGEDFMSSGPAGGAEAAQFESSFPAIDDRNEQIGPGGAITGTTYGQQSSYGIQEEEPEVIKQWRERRDLALSHRAETAAAKKEETIKSAQTAIDDFYNNYNSKKDKGITQTQKEAEEFLAKREDTSAGGTSWERIAKLVDLSGKGTKGGASGTGKEKFRELLTSLKKDEKAPGASGV